MRPLVGFVCVCWVVSAAQAEIIIDDFDDTAIVINNDPPATNLHVGPLAARRVIGIDKIPSSTIVEGHIDSNVSAASRLTMDMIDISGSATSFSLVVMFLDYWFEDDTIDLTQNGQNDALLLDLHSLSGLTPPPEIQFLVQETTGVISYAHFLSPVPTSDDSFTIAIPFSRFTARGRGPQTATFETVYHLNMLFRANEFFGAPQELGWTAVLDRVRVGAIPEPNSLALFLVGLLLFFPRRF